MVIEAASKLPEEDYLGRMLAGFDAMLESVASPDVQRIAMMDAPVVFGPDNWRLVEEKYVYGALKIALARLHEQGRIVSEVSVTALTPMLFGAMVEAAFTIARSDDPERAREEAKKTLTLMMRGVIVAS